MEGGETVKVHCASGCITEEGIANLGAVIKATLRGMEVAGKVLGEDKVEEALYPTFRRRFALLEEDGSGHYGTRIMFRLRQPKTPKEMMETAYKLLSKRASLYLGENVIPSVSFDGGWLRLNRGGRKRECEEHDRMMDRPYVIELQLELLCGGEESLKSAVRVVEGAAEDIGRKYEWDDKTPWKFWRKMKPVERGRLQSTRRRIWATPSYASWSWGRMSSASPASNRGGALEFG